jgi:hypothetical protein
MRGLAGFFLEAHRQELGLAARLLLHADEELALGLLGREPRDRLQLAAMLVERRAEPRLLLDDRALATEEAVLLQLVVRDAALDLVELAGQLLVLLDDPLLDLLDLALAPAGLLVQLGAGLEGDLPGLELGGLAVGVGLALGILDDPARPDLGGPDPAVGQDLVEGDPGDEPQAEANRRKQPNRIHVHLQRTHGVDVNDSPKYLPRLTIIAGGSGVRTK